MASPGMDRRTWLDGLKDGDRVMSVFLHGPADPSCHEISPREDGVIWTHEDGWGWSEADGVELGGDRRLEPISEEFRQVLYREELANVIAFCADPYSLPTERLERAAFAIKPDLKPEHGP